jgi:hypothetical protein
VRGIVTRMGRNSLQSNHIDFIFQPPLGQIDDVAVASEPGKGSVFTVRMPAGAHG